MGHDTAIHAIIVAGGRGERAGLPMPKQYMPLHGRPVLAWSADAFLGHAACESVTIVVPLGDEARAARLLCDRNVLIVAGGATRQQSVAAGIAAIAGAQSPDNLDRALVFVHDAARPGLSSAVIDDLIGSFANDAIAGALPSLPVADTLAREDGQLGDVVPRDALVRVQTPQAFRWSALAAAHSEAATDEASDDAQLVRANGGRIALVPGAQRLDKITSALDYQRMYDMLTPRYRTAVGSGFDVHRLIGGTGLWLGGVYIAHDRTLDGHSDADVLLHAITDAVLGAAAAGDIGTHFPPTDPRWRGASSDQFLAHAAELTAQRGGIIDHVDCTVVCEAPKIGPHRVAMQRRIAEILALTEEKVNVKATTTERLGFTGRGEGIAAEATVTLRLPVADEPA